MTSIAYGIAFPASRGILTGGFVPQAVSFFGRLATQPTDTRKRQYNALIAALVSAGVWAKLDALYLFAAADQATALTNLVSSSYGATAVNSPTFTADRGFTPNGSTSYVDSNFNPATATSPQYALNAAHYGAWSLTARAALPVAICGNTRSHIFSRYTGDAIYARVNDLGGSVPNANSSGFFIGSRTASNSRTPYRNGVSLGSTSDAVSAVDSNTMFAAGGYNAGALTSPSSDRIALFCAGGALTATDVANFYNAAYAYLHAVGAV